MSSKDNTKSKMNLETAHCYILTVKGDVRAEVDQEVIRLCDTLAQQFPDHNVQKLDPLQPIVQVHMVWDGNSWVWPTSINAGWMEITIPDPGNTQIEVLHIPTPVEGACIIYGNEAIDKQYVKSSDGLYILNKKSIFDFMNFVPGFFTSPFISQMVSVLLEKYKSIVQTNICLENETKTRQSMEEGLNSQIQSWKDKYKNLKAKFQVCNAEFKEKQKKMEKKVEALQKKNAEFVSWKSENTLNVEKNDAEIEKWKMECDKLRQKLDQEKQNSKKSLDDAMEKMKAEQKRFKKMIHEQMQSTYEKKVKSLEEKLKEKDITSRSQAKQIKEDAKWIKKQNKEIVQLTKTLKEREGEAVTADEILDYAKLRGLMVDMCQKAGISGCSLKEGNLTDMLLKVIGIIDDVMAKVNQYSEGKIDMHSLTIMVELFKANKKTKYTFKDMHELFAVQHYRFDQKLKQFMKILDKMKEQKLQIQRENHNLRSQLMRHILRLNDESGIEMDSRVLCKDIVILTKTIMASEVKHGLTFWGQMVGKYSIDPRLHIVSESVAIVATRVISATLIQRQYRRYYCMKMYQQIFNKKSLSSMSTSWGLPGVDDPDGKYGVKYYCMSKRVWKRKLRVIFTSDKKSVCKYKNECAYAVLRYILPRNMEYITEQIKNLVEVILMKEIPVSGPVVRASHLQKKIRGFYRDKNDMVKFSQSDDPENIRAQMAMMYQDQLSDATDEINSLIDQYPKTWHTRFILGVPIPEGDVDKLKSYMFYVFEQQKEKDRYFVDNRVQKVPRDLVNIWHLSEQSAIRLSVKWNTLHNCVVSNMYPSESLPEWFSLLYGKEHPINRNRSTSP